VIDRPLSSVEEGRIPQWWRQCGAVLDALKAKLPSRPSAMACRHADRE